jgi:hypothetical protein
MSEAISGLWPVIAGGSSRQLRLALKETAHAYCRNADCALLSRGGPSGPVAHVFSLNAHEQSHFVALHKGNVAMHIDGSAGVAEMEWRPEMKRMFLAAAALVIAAAPAFAQSYDPEVGSGNIVQSLPQSVYQGPEGAFARVPGASRRRTPSAVYQAPNVVYDEYGQVIGADPDPNVRLQLQKDHNTIQ